MSNCMACHAPATLHCPVPFCRAPFCSKRCYKITYKPHAKVTHPAISSSNSTTVKASSHGGLGVFASTAVTKGTLLLLDPTLLTVSETDTQSKVNQARLNDLPETTRDKVFELADNANTATATTPKTLEGIIKTNAYPTNSPAEGSLHHLFARFNHSCDPNTSHRYIDLLGMRGVWASRNIAEGEELFSSYVDVFTSREKRREELRERFDFDCRCRSCERGDANDDAKRQRIRVLDETVYENVKVGDYNDARIHIEERRRLLEETKLDSPAEMYRLANDEQQCEEHRGSNPERALKAAREVEHFGSLCMLREQQAFIELGENIKKLELQASKTAS
ncbi:hypothetical protein ScalyP_jg10188 [Parmales sp. scaly parma]|nr:hypothetical protein ScalyP_jg10188 [Parmales sp. scaly parma]